jgi:hypothetical protein
VCACDHLTTFGLLSELDQMMSAQQQQPTSGAGPTEPQAARPILARTHLDTVEGELALDDGQATRAIYMTRVSC